jgi:pimeloyl-ACP methyl ester carboxylesterase
MHFLRLIFQFYVCTTAVWVMVGQTCCAEASPKSEYIRNQNSSRVIVFVHGFRGDSVDTWSNGSMYWPEMIASDHDFDGVDVFVYQYPTSLFTAGMTPDELSSDMQAVLSAEKVLERQQIIFIAHSMGGIITRNFLLLDSEAASRTALIQFLATPTEGASMANLAAILDNPQVTKMSTNIEGGFLGELSRHWKASERLRDIPSYCAYETQDFMHVRIVPYESATYLCNRDADPVDGNHFDIAKPKSISSAPYATFKKNYLQVFSREPAQINQDHNALIVVGSGGSIGTFKFNNNVVVTPVPRDILHTDGSIGDADVNNNWIMTPSVPVNGQPGLSAQGASPRPPFK